MKEVRVRCEGGNIHGGLCEEGHVAHVSEHWLAHHHLCKAQLAVANLHHPSRTTGRMYVLPKYVLSLPVNLASSKATSPTLKQRGSLEMPSLTASVH